MPALISILSLLRNPWILLILACAIGAGGTSWYRAKYHAVLAQDALAVSAAQKKADDLANELIIAQAAAMAATSKTITVFRDKVNHAPQTNTCGPVLRDAARGLCVAFGGGQPDAKCGVVAPVH